MHDYVCFMAYGRKGNIKFENWKPYIVLSITNLLSKTANYI